MATKTQKKNIVLQDRDRSLIRMLAEDFRILSREQISQLFPMGSVSRINFRLKKLCDAGYLSYRLLPTTTAGVKRGYYLGPRAYEVFGLAEHTYVEFRRKRVARLAPSSLPHRMLVDSVHIRFLTAKDHYPDYKMLTWIDQYDSWWKSVRKYGVPIQADGYTEYLVLRYADSLFTFFLELDRGTERGNAIRHKINRYIRYADSGDYKWQFATKKPFRVLLITTTRQRAQQLMRINKARTDKTFWVTSWPEFNESKLFDSYWRRPHKKGTYSLLSQK